MAETEREEVQTLREVMTAFRETAIPVLREIVSLLPNLLEQIHAVFYDEENAKRLGQSIGAYYRSLKEAGLPEEMCQELTIKYAEGTNLDWLTGLMKSAMSEQLNDFRPREIAAPVRKALPEG
ncbi:MAG: hypothetical protein NZ805_06260 [Armatimonadetes bacterium]|nr:hypothetical protein [Armatimonadota bacterium]MDW8028603.1 hypothetical protein [Armatimonadota bacterium]